MTAFNAVRFRVKPGREQEFLDAHKKRAGALSGYGRERCLHLFFGTSSQDNQLKPKHTCSGLHIP